MKLLLMLSISTAPVVLLLVAVCGGILNHDAAAAPPIRDAFSQLHRLPAHGSRRDVIEARVAELELTHPWFLNHTQTVQHAASTSGSRLPCPVPAAGGDVLFGLGYEAVADSMRTASCWIAHQHRQAGNVDVDYMTQQKASLVHGAGVSELLIASIMALAGQFAPELGKPIVTTTLAPYYAVLKQVCLSSVLRGVAEWVEPEDVRDAGTSNGSSAAASRLRGRPLILVAIVPSNPIGSVQSGLLSHCSAGGDDPRLLRCFDAFPARVVSDHSYFWPCLVPRELRNDPQPSGPQAEWQWRWPLRPLQSSALLFGLSKLSGHSGVRHGWAWVMDGETAALMRQHLWELGTSLSASAISQSALVLATISLGTAPTFHAWCETEMVSRYRELHRRLPAGYRVLSTQQSATALIECPAAKHDGAPLCAQLLHDAGILASSGTAFGASNDTARISMGLSAAAFAMLLQRLEQLPDATR